MFDTLKYSRVLESAGVSRDQAEAHVRIISEIVEDDMATKQDIRDIRSDLEKLEYRLVIKLSAVLAVQLTLAIAITTVIIKLV